MIIFRRNYFLGILSDLNIITIIEQNANKYIMFIPIIQLETDNIVPMIKTAIEKTIKNVIHLGFLLYFSFFIKS